MEAQCGDTSTIPGTVPTPKSSKQRRSRPNLSKLCQKTKMCGLFLRGACKQAESCSFAHDEKELQCRPDLSRTKPCPELLRVGHCSRQDCKFAHDASQIREHDFDGLEIPGTEREPMPPQTSMSSTTHDPISCIPSYSESCFSIPPCRRKLLKALSDARLIGALSIDDMTTNLTRIFSALYEARPDAAQRLNRPADVVAAATAEKAWADAGIDSSSVLNFQDVIRWCALPSDILCQEVAHEQKGHLSMESLTPATPQHRLMSTKLSIPSDDHSKDEDTWSQCSTDAGISNHSVWEIRESLLEVRESLLEEEDLCEPELIVMNTFIHFSQRRGPNSARRARSLPIRPSEFV